MKRRWGRTALASATAVACLASASCGIRPATAERDPGTLVIDTANYPSTLDPGKQYDADTYSVYRNIFDQLLRRNPRTGAVAPWLATSWRQTSATTWRFTMRSGVTFSDGSPLTAADAAFSINRILDKKFASQQFANFSMIGKATVEGGDLIVHTPVPAPTLLTYLTTLSVVPEKYVRQAGDQKFAARPIGSGPYVFASATAGSQVTLKANPRWWRPRPSVRAAVFRSVPSVASRVVDLQSRKADLATNLTPDAADQVKRDPKLAVLSVPTERIAYLAFNTIKGGPANDPKVRRAIAAAIDYNALIKNLQRGYAKPINSLLSPLSFGYDRTVPNDRYDPAMARRLIAEAGARGKTVVMDTSPSFNPQIVQAIQANLGDVGLSVQIRSTDQPTYLKKVQDPKHNWGSLRFGRWSCSCLDADGVIYPLFHTGGIWSSYTNPDFDKAVEQARQVIDPKRRATLYHSAFQLLARDLPGVGLFQDYAIYGANSRVSWTPDAQESFYLDTMKVR